MQDRDLNVIIARVMRYTVNMSVERITWQKAPAILGVLAWGDSEAIAVVQGWIDRAIETQTSEGCLNYSDVEEYGAGHALTLTPTAGLIASLGYQAVWKIVPHVVEAGRIHGDTVSQAASQQSVSRNALSLSGQIEQGHVER